MIFIYQQYLEYSKYEQSMSDWSKYTPMFFYSKDLLAIHPQFLIRKMLLRIEICTLPF